MNDERKHSADFLHKLDWHLEPSVLNQSIQDVAAMVKGGQVAVPDLIQPLAGKMYWEEAARVLLALPPQYLDGHEALLFDAIQDSNWPGFDQFIDLLARQPIAHLLPLYTSAYEQAKQEDDDLWVWCLYRLGQRINIQQDVEDVWADMRLYLESLEWEF